MLRHAVHRPTGSLASGALPWTAGRGGIARAAARAPRASPPPLQPGARALAAGAPAGRAYVAVAGIEVDRALKRLVDEVIMPGTGVEPEPFWRGFAAIALELAPRNRALLDERDSLQAQIDAYHVARRGQPHDAAEYRAFLTQIGYLIAPPSTAGPATVRTTGVDPEIAETAGPQLVCPVDNARFIVNAANARWGSLLDALYGTDVVPGPRGGPYSPERGAAVWDEAHRYLDRIFPLDAGARTRAPRPRPCVRRGGGAPPAAARDSPTARARCSAHAPRLPRRRQVGQRAWPDRFGRSGWRPASFPLDRLHRAYRPARPVADCRLPRRAGVAFIHPAAQPRPPRRARD